MLTKKMTVGVMAGEKDAVAARRPEQGAADATEMECAAETGDVIDPISAGVAPPPPDFGDALSERCVREMKQPGDLLARVAGQRQKRGGSQCSGQCGYKSPGHVLVRDGCCRICLPAGFALSSPDSGTGFECGPLAYGTLQPSAVVGTGKIRTARLYGREQHRLQQVFRFIGSSRGALRLAQQFEIGP